MNVSFIRFKATDEVELQGWLSQLSGDTAVLHMHGMSGNGYENYFLDNLREMYSKHSVTFFSIDNRGRGVITDFRQGEGTKQGGSCFELIEESVHDIAGAIEYLKNLGKTKIILQGHSLGCIKVVNYLLEKGQSDIQAAILIAPTDMVKWGDVGKWMWENKETFNGLSVLPYFGGTYTQAPFQDCTKEEFEEMITHLHNIDLSKVIEFSDETSLAEQAACAGGACEIV
jgi:pimeloyl-ACP methyl ester carboxylesterase